MPAVQPRNEKWTRKAEEMWCLALDSVHFQAQRERKLIIYLMFNTQSTTKVVAGQHTVHYIVSKKCDWVLQHILQYAWRGFGEEEKNEVKEMGKQKFNKAEFLAAGRAFKAILWPAPDVTDRAFCNSSFSAEGP